MSPPRPAHAAGLAHTESNPARFPVGVRSMVYSSCGTTEPLVSRSTLWALRAAAAEPSFTGLVGSDSCSGISRAVPELFKWVSPVSPKEEPTAPLSDGLGFSIVSPAPGMTAEQKRAMLRISSSPNFRALSRSEDPFALPSAVETALLHRGFPAPQRMRCSTVPEEDGSGVTRNVGTYPLSAEGLVQHPTLSELFHARSGPRIPPPQHGEQPASFDHENSCSGFFECLPAGGSGLVTGFVPPASVGTFPSTAKQSAPPLDGMGGSTSLDSTTEAYMHAHIHVGPWGKYVRDSSMMAMEKAAAAHALKTYEQGDVDQLSRTGQCVSCIRGPKFQYPWQGRGASRASLNLLALSQAPKVFPWEPLGGGAATAPAMPTSR